MKKILTAVALIAAANLSTQSVQAQFLNNLLSTVANAASTAAGSATSSEAGSTAGNLVSNLISSVTGSITTTQANLIGAWTYSEPAVQFESENLLTQAGGSAIATKVESKLATYYKIVGIKAGTMKFTFAEDGNVTYAVGKLSREATYTFDEKEKTVTITPTIGPSVTAHVTISGSNMDLVFDGTKLLTLFNTLSTKFSALSTVSSLANNYNGMKVGFGFKK